MSVSNEPEPSHPASAAAIPAIREKAEKQTLRFPRSVDVDPARRLNRRADVLFVDLDGTLLNNEGVVTRRVADALRAAAEKGVLVCVATGKARPAARRALATALLDGAGGVTGDASPGVFLQGLDVRAPGGGSISNASMPEDVVRDAFAFHGGEMRETRRVQGDASANANASSGELLTLRDSSYAEPATALTAFCGEECHTVGAEPHALLRELASRFHEPKSVPWDDVDSLLSAARATRLEDDRETSGVSKLLLAADDAATVSFWRPEWEALLGSRAVVTQAVPTMLEVLPVGHDKTTGFETLVRRLADESGLAFEAGVKPAKKTSPDEDGDFVSGASSLLRVVAVGDGENDAGMLRAASVGVALANACDETKRAADHVLSSSNEEDGVAEAVSKFVL
jgi:hydroxymethylpyrimidine pyrophosphatase-like HAD family hydrolase